MDKTNCTTQWFGERTTSAMTKINKGYCHRPQKSFTHPPHSSSHVPTRVTTVICGIQVLAFLHSFNTPAWITKFYSLISSAFSILYYIHGNMPHAFFSPSHLASFAPHNVWEIHSQCCCGLVQDIHCHWCIQFHRMAILTWMYPFHCGWIFGGILLGGHYG